MRHRPLTTGVLAALGITCWQFAACGPMEEESSANGEAPLASEGAPVADEKDSLQPHVMMTNGNPLVPGSQYANTAVMTADGCRGTLLTNSWVLSAQHCEAAYWNPPGQEFVWYEQSCTPGNNAPCLPRNAQCKSTQWGNYCGRNVKQVYRNPKSNPDPGLGAQVDLWQLDAPIYSGGSQVPYSIGQQVYYGTKSSLQNKTITIIGHCGTCSPQPLLLAQNTFKISGSQSWSYLLSNTGGSQLEGGDSGGPGYYYANGVYYLTGVTQTTNSQHDLVETWTGGTMHGWIEDTLFSAPNAIQSNAQGFAMALTSTGAVQAFVRNGSYYFSQCDSEPCDQRGVWSTPGYTASGRTAAPAIAIDTIPGWGLAGAQIFIADTAGVTAHAVVKGAYLGATELGGSCTSPAGAYSRPQTDPPILDVVCRGTDGNLYINHRVNNAYWGWGSIGKPSAGIRSGIAPAVVAINHDTVYVAVAGSDGKVYIQPGRGDVGWTGWASLGNPWGRSLRSVALASYAPERLDVIAIDSGGKMWQRIGTGDTLGKNWNSTWSEITGRTWSSTVPPFAASYGWKYGLMNAGGIGTDGNAYIQRYSDW